MLAITNLSYFITGEPLFEEANLHIKPKNRIGLIGKNGAGKSTLLRLINGEYTPDEGEITKAKDCSIGFLNQDLLSMESDESILKVAMDAFSEAIECQKQIDVVLHQMETNYSDDLVDKLSKLQEDFERLEGYTIQSRAEEILEGLGFSTAELQKPLKEFSGGWRMRVMLAKLLLEKPALLMLDEPTNHLDLPSIQWIENYITTYDGAVIVVSHDRQFLDNVTNITVEVSHKRLHLYSGNYSFYLQERELRREIQQAAFENQQQQIKQTEQFIERFRSKASKARQVQSKVKSLERIDKVDEVVDENRRVNFKFTFGQNPGKTILEFKDISKSYGDKKVLDNTSNHIMRGDKIALIGANGIGKSTMLRIINGMESFEGERVEGHNVKASFFAQHQLESLDIEAEILEELKMSGSDKTEQELRKVLGCFLFTDEDVFKKIKVLSGGEKSRVALAKTLISESNFLLLDEPTNHLDIQSVNILIQALQQYEGTFVVVSHDRHFVNEVANKIWYIEDQQLKEYPGSYAEYLDFQAKRALSNTSKKEEKTIKKEVKVTPQKKNKPIDKKAQNRLKKVEQEIERLEGEKAVLQKELEKPAIYADPDALLTVNTDLGKVQEQLDELELEWTDLMEVLEG